MVIVLEHEDARPLTLHHAVAVGRERAAGVLGPGDVAVVGDLDLDHVRELPGVAPGLLGALRGGGEFGDGDRGAVGEQPQRGAHQRPVNHCRGKRPSSRDCDTAQTLDNRVIHGDTVF